MAEELRKKIMIIKFCTVHSVEKIKHEVQKLIAGPSVFICEECVDLM